MSKRSWVWNHCTMSENGGVQCNMCDKRFKSKNSTSPLIKHLSKLHGLKNEEHDTEPCNIPYKDDDKRKEKIDKLLIDLITLDLQPFTIVEDKGFKALINFLDPRYNIPTRKSLKELVKAAYEEKKRAVQEELDVVTDICITTDTWTSINTDSFLTVTCHFLNNNFEMRTYILQTEKIHGSHNGSAIADSLKNIFSQWKIKNKVRTVVTDNAKNMLAAVNKLDSVESVHCFAHTLNLVVKKALGSIEEIENIRKKSRRIISYFKSSCVATDKLNDMQTALHLPKHKLIIEIDTRWNSIYEMLERLLEQKNAVIAALSFCNSSIDILDSTEWEYISQCLPILRYFYVLTAELSSESYVSISKVIISIKQLRISLNPSSDHILTQRLQQMLDQYFENIEVNQIYSIGTVLDPRFKLLGFESNETAEAAKALVLQCIIPNTDNNITSTASNSSTIESTMNNDALWFSFDAEVLRQNSFNSGLLSPKSELNNYLSEPFISRHSNPLDYWFNNNNRYPHLSILARKILSCPATSVPSERVFSKAGNIITKKRNRLKESTLNMILLLNK